jgi:aerobic-type carbon monoxide dehydrogenase small subunit (CoxS/CutS family)
VSEDSDHSIEVAVNGETHRATVRGRQLLVHFIRDTLGLRGTHIGCDSGNCGACTVRCDGKLIKSCMMLAVQADGCDVRTVEGLSGPDDELTPLQSAFSEHHALQCGYCTPGFLMNAEFLLERNPHPTEQEIRRALKGNLCRCTGYVNIVKAIAAAAAEAAGPDQR